MLTSLIVSLSLLCAIGAVGFAFAWRASAPTSIETQAKNRVLAVVLPLEQITRTTTGASSSSFATNAHMEWHPKA